MTASRWLPRTLFGQFVLVIALVLAGAGLLAALLGRELATRPAAQQLMRAMDGFANVVEELDRHQPRARTLALSSPAGASSKSARTPASSRPVPARTGTTSWLGRSSRAAPASRTWR